MYILISIVIFSLAHIYLKGYYLIFKHLGISQLS